jgi:uncharacterized membrane protein
VRDDAASSSYQQGTGSFRQSPPSYDLESGDDTGLMYRVGQAAMIVSGVALVALAARKATGHRLLPESVTQRASDAIAAAPVEAALTIGKPRAELYTFWRRFENLPQFMKHLDEVNDLGDGRSHWVGKSPLGFSVEWDAEIVEERQDQLISWRSLPGSQIHNAGTVFFEDDANGRGTIVRVTLELGSANPVGQAVGKVFAPVTERQVLEDLRRFKQLMEIGEIPTTEGQSHGARSLVGRTVHSPF